MKLDTMSRSYFIETLMLIKDMGKISLIRILYNAELHPTCFMSEWFLIKQAVMERQCLIGLMKAILKATHKS